MMRKKLNRKELKEMYYNSLVEFYPFWYATDNVNLKMCVESHWGRMVERGYMTQEEAEAMPYILGERLNLLGKILGRDVAKDFEKYKEQPYLFEVV